MEATRTRRLLLTDAQMPEPDVLPIAGGHAAVFSARAPDKEGPNQDAVAAIDLGERAGVLVVADGLGGQPGGASASATALECLASSLAAPSHPEGPVRAAILDGVESANRAVMEMGIGAATTLAAVEIADATLRPYHVGDSAILVTGQRGKIKLLTIAHSPVGYALESGLLDEHEALHHDDRHLVSNIVGEPSMRIEVGSPQRLAARDTLLLGTDGLFDNLRLQEIVETVRSGPLATAARALALSCASRMQGSSDGHPSKPDDLSFVLFRLDS